MSKRSSRKPVPPADETPRWRKALLMLTVVPLVGGILLILAALFEVSLWGSLTEQAILGVLYIMASFAASNLLQTLWLPGGGWLLLTIAAWLSLSRPEAWVRYLAIAFAAAGVLLLSGEFLKRFWERQGKKE